MLISGACAVELVHAVSTATDVIRARNVRFMTSSEVCRILSPVVLWHSAAPCAVSSFPLKRMLFVKGSVPVTQSSKDQSLLVRIFRSGRHLLCLFITARSCVSVSDKTSH